MDGTTVLSRCPAAGRTAKWCEDQSHAACWAALPESIALDRRVVAALREEVLR